MSQHDNVPASHSVRSGGYLCELLHDTARGREQGTRERVGVAFLARVLAFLMVKDFGLTARREKMPRFMTSRLGSPLAGVICVEQHAGAERIIVCKKP